MVASVGELSGAVPYTTFYARKSYIEKNSDIIEKFTNAINKALVYTIEHDSTTIANDIINQFPDTDVNDLATMIERYREYDTWLPNSIVDEELFTNLEDFLIDFELIDDYVPFNDLVTNFYHD